MPSQNIHRTIGRNSFSNLLRHLVNAVTIIVLTPKIINSIGNAQYGLWALIFSIIGYAGILDMGIQQATIKFIAHYNGVNDKNELNKVASTALFFFSAIGISAALFCWVIAPNVIVYFLKDASLLLVSRTLFAIIGVDVIFVFIANVCTGIILGIQLYHIKGFVDIFCCLIRLASTIYFLNNGYGIVALAWIKLGIDLFSTISLLLICINNAKIRFSLFYINKKTFKMMISFGSKIFLSSSMIRLNNYTNDVIISLFMNTVWVAYYSVALSFTSYLRGIFITITAIFLPIFSEINAIDDPGRVEKIYLQYTRYLIILFIPSCIGIYAFGYYFVKFWINVDYAEHCLHAIKIFGVDLLIFSLQPLIERYFIGSGDVSFYSKVLSFCSIIGIILSIFLVKYFGMIGAPLSIAMVSTIRFVILLRYLLINFKINYVDMLKNCYVRYLPAFVVLYTAFCNLQILIESKMYYYFGVAVFLSVAAYILLVYFLYFNSNEKLITKKYLKNLFNISA